MTFSCTPVAHTRSLQGHIRRRKLLIISINVKWGHSRRRQTSIVFQTDHFKTILQTKTYLTFLFIWEKNNEKTDLFARNNNICSPAPFLACQRLFLPSPGNPPKSASSGQTFYFYPISYWEWLQRGDSLFGLTLACVRSCGRFSTIKK